MILSGWFPTREKGNEMEKKYTVTVAGKFATRDYEVTERVGFVKAYRLDSKLCDPTMAESVDELMSYLQAECDRDPKAGRVILSLRMKL